MFKKDISECWRNYGADTTTSILPVSKTAGDRQSRVELFFVPGAPSSFGLNKTVWWGKRSTRTTPDWVAICWNNFWSPPSEGPSENRNGASNSRAMISTVSQPELDRCQFSETKWVMKKNLSLATLNSCILGLSAGVTLLFYSLASHSETMARVFPLTNQVMILDQSTELGLRGQRQRLASVHIHV